MKKRMWFFIAVSMLLTGCVTDKEIGQAVLMSTPVVFLISLAFQYLFFRMWNRKWSNLTISWFPNFVFLIILTFIGLILGNTKGAVDFGITFGASYLSLLLIFTRIWLLFNHSKVFTWASILAMSLFVLPAFPMVAGITKGTPFLNNYVVPLWGYPSGWRLISSSFETTGLLTALIFLVLWLEAGLKTRKKG